MRREMITNHQIPDYFVLEILRARVHAMCHQETTCDGLSPGPEGGVWVAYHLSSPLGATARAPAAAPPRAASAVLPSRLAPPRDRARASPGCYYFRPERRCCSRGCGATAPTATSTRPDAMKTRRRSEVSRRALSSLSCPWCGAIEVLGKVNGAGLSAG
jgi:hypothetical protein